MRKFLDKVFGGLKISWPVVIIMAVAFGVYTALMAMFVPDGNSFHDIAATAEAWMLPAIIIIVNSKKPLEAALKTFVFFLISQPLVYLIEVPFNSMGWGLFGYYRFWFIVTLFTFPGAFLGWYIKKDKFYSGIILSIMLALLVWTGVGYARGLAENFPNHLLSMIYCFGIVPVLIFGIFKKKEPRIVAAVISVVVLVLAVVIDGQQADMFETYQNGFVEENNIVLVGEPYVSAWSGTANGNVEIINAGDGMYSYKISGAKSGHYYFTISDSENSYDFEYYYDPGLKTVVVDRVRN